jgi:chromate reductase
MSRLLALAASYREPSLNKQLLALAVEEATRGGASVTLLDYAALDAPYRGETVADGIPPAIAELAAMLPHHDGILLATPEYNWSIPGALKNILDWLSITAVAPLTGKTALLMCASPSTRGGISGLQQLRTPMELLGCWVYPQLIGIGRAHDHFGEGQSLREADDQYLRNCVHDFVRATKALSHAA